jgi:hypothetical protein
MTDLPRHIANCLAALERFGRVSELDRMQALGTWEDLASRTDAAALTEALDRLNGKPVPCLPPAITPRCRKERRTLARWLTVRAIRSGTVLWLP